MASNLDSLEGSIQNLLSVLYPPFEATAPTLLSQLFQIIDSRYQGDTLRCFLDFLIPAKHILETVQQAACAQYSDVLFLCEGWPLCLCDQVVIHLASINPLLLQPGDFYLQVVPFCDQSARIVVCSLLQEEGFRGETVEETPIPETSYPCIFKRDWLDEINSGRQGTPLSRCLLATEQGVVRLPWERVAVPDFVDRPHSSGSSMASASPSYSPLTSSSCLLPTLSDFPQNSSPNQPFPPPPPSKESGLIEYPVTIHSSISASSSHPSTFSVETRICPAKHGIAVSLCLVDARSASSSKLVRAKETEAEPKPIGWVSPNTWDSRFTEKVGTPTKTGTFPDMRTPENADMIACKAESQGMIVSKSIEKDQHKDTNRQDTSSSGTQAHGVGEGEYIDAVQASMLFSRAQSLTEDQQKAAQAQIVLQAQTESQMQRSPQRGAQIQPHAQMEAHGQRPQATQSHTHMQLVTKPQSHNHSASSSETPNMSAAMGPSSTTYHTHSRSEPLEGSQRVCAVRFSEKPCTPCMRRRLGGKVTRAQELRCRYRDSYQAAIQNPVTFGHETERANMLTVVEDDRGFSQFGDRQGAPENETGLQCWNVQRMWSDPGMQNQPESSVCEAICEELGEENMVSYWKPEDASSNPSLDYRGVKTLQFVGLPERTSERTTVSYTEPQDAQSANSYSNLHNVSRANSAAETRTNPTKALPRINGTSQTDVSTKHQRLPFTSSGNSGMHVTPNSCEALQNRTSSMGTSSTTLQSRQEHMLDGRCSSLSTAVVDTSEKCELVIVDGKNVRRRENAVSTTEIPQLHVVKCRNSTAFRLVSPKINRRKLVIPGGRDRSGRAIVELYGDHQGWQTVATSQELLQMLLYFHSITRREIREAGMTLIFDARRSNPQPQIYKALMTLQTDMMSSMKSLLKLVEASQLSALLGGMLAQNHTDWEELHQKLFPFVHNLHVVSSLLQGAISKLEEPQRTETVQAVQQCIVDQRTLMREVLEDSRLVSLQREGGAMLVRLRKESDLKYPHWEDFSDAVDSMSSLYNHVEEQAHILVQKSNMSLEHLEYLLQLRQLEGHLTQIQQWFIAEGERHLLEAESVEDSGDRMEQILNSFTGFLIEANDRRHHAMSLVSEAEQLQQSGLSYTETEAFRAFVSNFKSSLEDFLCRAEACGRELQVMVNVCDFCEQATTLASECMDFLDQNQSITCAAQDHQSASQMNQVQHQNHDSSLNAASLSDTHAACGSGPASTDSQLRTDSSILQVFQDRFTHFCPERFQEVKAQASILRGSRGMRVWNTAWLKCQEARQQLQERMQSAHEVSHQQADSSSWCEGHFVDVVSTNVQTASPGGQRLVVQSTPGPRHPRWEDIVSGAVDLGRRHPMVGSSSPNSTTVACCNIIVKPEEYSDAGTCQGSKSAPQSPHKSARKAERETRKRQTSRARTERDAAALSQSHTVGCQWFPWGRGLVGRSVSQDSCTTGVATAGSSTPPDQLTRPPSSCSHHGQPSCRILQEAQKFQISRHGSFCSEDSCMSEQGAAADKRTSFYKHSSLSTRRYEGPLCLEGPQESSTNALRLQRVMEELLFTEREYVRSLGYILTHYLPLMDRLDIPQELRGKRGVIFGNLEKLYDFHSRYFLPELEACQREPAMVARCFLRHSESFGLYALYSKNKPQSDALILHRRPDIFKKKQQDLGDMMDLSSYLLRPIQRISKYSLLLQDILALVSSYRPKDTIQDALFTSSLCAPRVCNTAIYMPDLTDGKRERERAEIQAAADLVRFQMRHGNDLLTMDAIQDCDVNLKEQGQLIRQDEFTVFFRKKKCVRRIFLFEDLILFSKTKKTDVGNDVYIYKQSFKTNDIGMTHNSPVSSLCFEIWFRRRKNEDTYTLRASSMDVKKAWTTELERILWDQATHSRELRMQERVFMGMGRKPFMDLQPNEAAICDRAVSCTMPGRRA
ncbi:pleckstrin homology domain-containing family G member 4B-like [Pholidichthys leucotaenia]